MPGDAGTGFRPPALSTLCTAIPTAYTSIKATTFPYTSSGTKLSGMRAVHFVSALARW